MVNHHHLGIALRQLGEHLSRVVREPSFTEDDLVVGPAPVMALTSRSCMIGTAGASR